MLALGPSAAGEATEAVEYREGRVVYTKRCPDRWAFSYFDGERLRRPCIGSSKEIPLHAFLGQARTSLCRMQIRVNHAVIENGVLLASDIEEVWDCPSRFGGYPIFFPKW